jgi:hypothetical protein
MAKREETGEERQRRIQKEQHRPEQNEGYDEAVRGGLVSANSLDKVHDLPPMPEEERQTAEQNDIDEREAQGAAADVRRQDRSAR